MTVRTNNYGPFWGRRHTGSEEPCACGVPVANQHSLRESAACDRKRALARGQQ